MNNVHDGNDKEKDLYTQHHNKITSEELNTVSLCVCVCVCYIKVFIIPFFNRIVLKHFPVAQNLH